MPIDASMRFLKLFERVVVLTLLGLMMIAILFSTIELAVVLVRELIRPPIGLLASGRILEVFGFFLMVLIGVELLESIKSYIEDGRVHAEVVVLVAIVAMARKAVILDHNTASPEILFGMGAAVLAFGIVYFLLRRANLLHTSADKTPPA